MTQAATRRMTAIERPIFYCKIEQFANEILMKTIKFIRKEN